MKDQPILDVKGVTKSYVTQMGRTVQAVSDISFTSRKNEFICLLGPSGCGKTTLLRLLAGLEQPTTGEILIDGVSMRMPDVKVGMVFQKYSLFPWRTVQDNITFGLELSGVSKSKRKKIARRYINLVQLKDFTEAYPHELSGGMQQRVAVARALATEPEILLMDEPFGALDAQTRSMLQKELLNIFSITKKTIFFVTHDITEAITLADHVYLMSSRPGTIKNYYHIKLPRPRAPEIRLTKAFNDILKEIWNDLSAEVQKSMKGSQA